MSEHVIKPAVSLHAGLVTLVAPLDFEVSREYYLSVEGSRGKSPLSDIATVIINVTDVNDNPPVFGRSDYSAKVSEDLSPGRLVMKVRGVTHIRMLGLCSTCSLLINNVPQVVHRDAQTASQLKGDLHVFSGHASR